MGKEKKLYYILHISEYICSYTCYKLLCYFVFKYFVFKRIPVYHNNIICM